MGPINSKNPKHHKFALPLTLAFFACLALSCETLRSTTAPTATGAPTSIEASAGDSEDSRLGVVDIAGCIIGGLLGGQWLDKKLDTEPAFIITGLILGIVLAFYGVYNMIKPIMDNIRKGEEDN